MVFRGILFFLKFFSYRVKGILRVFPQHPRCETSSWLQRGILWACNTCRSFHCEIVVCVLYTRQGRERGGVSRCSSLGECFQGVEDRQNAIHVEYSHGYCRLFVGIASVWKEAGQEIVMVSKNWNYFRYSVHIANERMNKEFNFSKWYTHKEKDELRKSTNISKAQVNWERFSFSYTGQVHCLSSLKIF